MVVVVVVVVVHIIFIQKCTLGTVFSLFHILKLAVQTKEAQLKFEWMCCLENIQVHGCSSLSKLFRLRNLTKREGLVVSVASVEGGRGLRDFIRKHVCEVLRTYFNIW